MVTGFITSPACLRHDTGEAHPERSGRLLAILKRLDASGLGGELACEEASEAETSWIERVHAPAYVARLKRSLRAGTRTLDAGDTTASRESWSAALTAVGAALQAGDRVMSGEWRNAFCAVRPPGHHAERDRAMGFCLFGNVAVLARYLQEQHGLARIAILDWDVHHGNGTQHMFEDDASVFYASLHQHPHYPGTGAASERGIGAGEGATLNVPLAAGTGDVEWLQALETVVLPALADHAPEALLISAGFDAHARDPLSDTLVTTEGFRLMSRRVIEFAQQRCGGRLISLLEGGYDLDALADSVQAHLEELRARIT